LAENDLRSVAAKRRVVVPTCFHCC
jgi:hypothetical protein